MGSMIHVLYQDNHDEHTCKAIVPMLNRRIESIETIEETMSGALSMTFEVNADDAPNVQPGLRISNLPSTSPEDRHKYIHIMQSVHPHIGARLLGVEFGADQHITMSGGREDEVTIVKIHTTKGCFAVAFHNERR